MLVIRDAQIQSLISQNDDDLEGLIIDAITRANPIRVDGIQTERLRTMVRIGIGKARDVGLTKAEDLGVFVALMFEVSPQFDQEPTINGVLGDTIYSPEDRLAQLFARVPDEAWATAVDLYDEKIWFVGDKNEPVEK